MRQKRIKPGVGTIKIFYGGNVFITYFFLSPILFCHQKIEFLSSFLKKSDKTYFCELGLVLRLGLGDSFTTGGRG